MITLRMDRRAIASSEPLPLWVAATMLAVAIRRKVTFAFPGRPSQGVLCISLTSKVTFMRCRVKVITGDLCKSGQLEIICFGNNPIGASLHKQDTMPYQMTDCIIANCMRHVCSESLTGACGPHWPSFVDHFVNLDRDMRNGKT